MHLLTDGFRPCLEPTKQQSARLTISIERVLNQALPEQHATSARRLKTMVVNSIDHLRTVIARCFPAYARMSRRPDHEDLVLLISWQMQSDSNLRSKTITLTIAREA